jgi:hypothetical protein
MITDRPPRKQTLLAEFHASDQRIELPVPADARLQIRAKAIAMALEGGKIPALLHACSEFLRVASDFYKVEPPGIRVLAARPLRVYEGGSMELFGDYNLSTRLIRVWMRTAVRKQVTSFGTFFSTLCHEFCHHLDCRGLGFRASPHTRGFYQRAAAIYHHARGTPARRLVWRKLAGHRWMIDWSAMRGAREPGRILSGSQPLASESQEPG